MCCVERFGENVLAIVEGWTDTDQTPKPPWRARKEDYIAHLDEASPSVLLVSLADKIHNAGSILRDLRNEGDSVWSRFTGGREVRCGTTAPSWKRSRPGINFPRW